MSKNRWGMKSAWGVFLSHARMGFVRHGQPVGGVSQEQVWDLFQTELWQYSSAQWSCPWAAKSRAVSIRVLCWPRGDGSYSTPCTCPEPAGRCQAVLKVSQEFWDFTIELEKPVAQISSALIEKFWNVCIRCHYFSMWTLRKVCCFLL